MARDECCRGSSLEDRETLRAVKTKMGQVIKVVNGTPTEEDLEYLCDVAAYCRITDIDGVVHTGAAECYGLPGDDDENPNGHIVLGPPADFFLYRDEIVKIEILRQRRYL